MIVVAIDPGVSGAIAFLGDCEPSVHDLPTLALPIAASAGRAWVPRRIDGRATALLIRQHVPVGSPAQAFCERVHAMRGGGDGKSSMQAEGSLMRSLGALEAVLDVLNLSPELVLPQAWQQFYGLVGKNVEMRGRGELPAAVRKAMQLYGNLAHELGKVKSHNKAEALLIGHYALRKLVSTG
jgi:hypothetical protein